ncbi:hypothetical protein [Haloarcula pellucida]|uniref:Uncharacterized protein n=1 Tax=Haloarcula pellucida TaxID=1427151 RepID=A0A830GSX2_9EURY|nr:hypothetical protein [Halomicroarcula pellucida]MBX0350508.1 hypothetical protein [Halomicroarcula pellucida]GGO03646.1 hypothetical protein GCM10009030_39540 [Halomicroarcula pellucida]
MSEAEQTTDPREWVLEEIGDRTEANPDSSQGVEADLWTSKGRLVKHANKFSTSVQQEPVAAALADLIDEREVLYWHGHLTLATIPYLNAVVQSEQRSDVTRQILIEKCRSWLESKAGGDDGGN